MTPTEQKALLLEKKFGDLVLNTSWPVPKPKKDEVLVKIQSVALNPCDWKIQKYGILVTTFPAILGSDIAGDVVEVGEGVSNFAVGDRVFFQGLYFQNGTPGFQQYATADVFTLAKIPNNVTHEEASSIPVGFTAAYVGLYNATPGKGLGYDVPITPGAKGKYAGVPLIVLGGSSSVGQYGIQLGKLSGFSPIITTSSLKHAEFLKSLGATHVLDRNAPLTAETIKSITDLPVQVILDGISTVETQKTGFELLGSGGGIATVLQPEPDLEERALNENKRFAWVMGDKVLPHNVQLLRDVYAQFTELLAKGDIKPNRVEVIPGGLNGVVEGLTRLQEDKVSGVKLVVRPQETN
ncbi:chaperonin 10-like protein [Ephemerocybe angulata]|uniref:Chaperonin 10-like protein n=1 Tax=Ephemerocybe angulata TaxID=980116 RepID=A0A8H6IJV5_9AGAR|nr:chaperonin 10-like protein [Tulosesus angulatus]